MRRLPRSRTCRGGLRSPAIAAAISGGAALDANIERRGLNGRVAVLGAVPQSRLTELYDGADVFVLASRFEGYGMAYAEAIAHGLPVIGTTTGATPDIVPDGAGMLVAPDDRSGLARRCAV